MKQVRKVMLAAMMLAPAHAALAETVYLECTIRGEIEPGVTQINDGIIRLSVNGSEITEWQLWSESSRRWISNGMWCENRGGHARGHCAAEPGLYSYSYVLPDLSHRILINRHDGSYSETQQDQDGRTTFSGHCRRTENPELTPARPPAL
jgi:hypothetical protein